MVSLFIFQPEVTQQSKIMVTTTTKVMELLLDSLRTSSTGLSTALGQESDHTDTPTDLVVPSSGSKSEISPSLRALTTLAPDLHKLSTMNPLHATSSTTSLLEMSSKNGILLEILHNNSKVISDISQYMDAHHRPWSVYHQELIKEGPNSTYRGDIVYVYSSHTEDISWLIPAILIFAFIFLLVVYVSSYGFEALRMLIGALCCFRLRGCCRRLRGQRSREEIDALTANMSQQDIEMAGMS